MSKFHGHSGRNSQVKTCASDVMDDKSKNKARGSRVRPFSFTLLGGGGGQ